MNLTLHPTAKLVDVDGVQARIWEGTTERGVPCFALIVRVGVDRNEDASEFERELVATRIPEPKLARDIPTRLVL